MCDYCIKTKEKMLKEGLSPNIIRHISCPNKMNISKGSRIWAKKLYYAYMLEK